MSGEDLQSELPMNSMGKIVKGQLREQLIPMSPLC